MPPIVANGSAFLAFSSPEGEVTIALRMPLGPIFYVLVIADPAYSRLHVVLVFHYLTDLHLVQGIDQKPYINHGCSLTACTINKETTRKIDSLSASDAFVSKGNHTLLWDWCKTVL